MKQEEKTNEEENEDVERMLRWRRNEIKRWKWKEETREKRNGGRHRRGSSQEKGRR